MHEMHTTRDLMNTFIRSVVKLLFMGNIESVLEIISNTKDCKVLKREKAIAVELEYALPEDLKYYLENYSSIIIFETAEYPFKIVNLDEFKRANPIIVGQDVEDDISHNWFIVATDDGSQYITIDLAPERLGKCYDSFWDIHGLAGDEPVVANSFTELLQRLYENKGEYIYWLKDDFQSLGDAYD